MTPEEELMQEPGDKVEKESFEQYCRRTRSWAVRIEFALLHSLAYRSLSYAPALKVLNWFYEKRSITVNKRKRGEKRYQVREVDIFFPYDEAISRGIDHKKFARAIRELHGRGFIDVVYRGSGLRGNPNKYRLSERWRAYGTDSFQHVTFPENRDWERRFSVVVGDGEYRRHIPRDEETGRWKRRWEEISQRQKSAVVRRSKSAVVNPDRRSKSAVVQADFTENTTAIIPSNPRSDTGYRSSAVRSKEDFSIGLNGQEVDCSRGRRDATKRWRPPRAELRENVKEILRQRPDPRASNFSFVRSIVDQIELTYPGNLLRQREVIREKDIDGWNIDLMMAITGINEVVH